METNQQQKLEDLFPLKKLKYTVTKCTDPQFDVNTCFENIFKNEEGYEKNEDYYFDSYSHFAVHEDMLKDRIRTVGYQNAIIKNPHLFENKIVLDIGCGTGILSIFAAQAGAKHVYGIDNASIINHAKKIIKDNKYDDKITLIKGKVEEVELPVKKVDIIISEWMGYFLLYESMFDTVLFARDKWLAPDGILLPDRAAIFLESIEDEEYKNKKIHFWDRVYGIDMSCITKWALMEPLVDTVDKQQINSDICPIFDIDLKTVQKEELNFTADFKLKINRNDYVHALVAHFEVYFSHSHIPTKLSTSPHQKETHWKQTIFYLQDTLPVFKDDILYGSIAVKKHKENERELEIKFSFNLQNKIKNYSKIQFYRLT